MKTATKPNKNTRRKGPQVGAITSQPVEQEEKTSLGRTIFNWACLIVGILAGIARILAQLEANGWLPFFLQEWLYALRHWVGTA